MAVEKWSWTKDEVFQRYDASEGRIIQLREIFAGSEIVGRNDKRDSKNIKLVIGNKIKPGARYIDLKKLTLRRNGKLMLKASHFKPELSKDDVFKRRMFASISF